MMSAKQWVGAAVAVGAVALATFTYAAVSPLLVADQVRTAALRGDRERLNELVDFTNVRALLKEDLRQSVAIEMRQEIAESGDGFAMLFGELGVGIAGAMTDAMVDQVVTPVALEHAARGESVPINVLGESNEAFPDFRVKSGEPGFSVKGGYRGWSLYEYKIASKADPDKAFTVQMRRQGLASWQIRRVTLDTNFLFDGDEGAAAASSVEEAPPLEPDEPATPQGDPDLSWQSSEFSSCSETAARGNDYLDCATAEADRQDGRLNVAYRALRTKHGDAERAELLSEQRAWLQHRDSTCSAETTAAEAEGESGELASALCLARESSIRALGLEELNN